ncbi:hypothetical protein XPR_3624, partial [Xanthomonas arboricola pv. pruni MAFF 301420]
MMEKLRMFRIESEDIEVGAGGAVVRVTQHYRTVGPFGAGDWGIGIRESQKPGGLSPRGAALAIPDSR